MNKPVAVAFLLSLIIHLLFLGAAGISLFVKKQASPPEEVVFSVNFQKARNEGNRKREKESEKSSKQKESEKTDLPDSTHSPAARPRTENSPDPQESRQSAETHRPQPVDGQPPPGGIEVQKVELAFSQLSQGCRLEAPVYPESALRFGLEAEFWIRLTVEPTGKVIRLEFLGAEPPLDPFLKSVTTAVRSWRFPVSTSGQHRIARKKICFIAGAVQ